MKKGQLYDWGKIQQDAFQQEKLAVKQAQALGIFDPTLLPSSWKFMSLRMALAGACGNTRVLFRLPFDSGLRSGTECKKDTV